MKKPKRKKWPIIVIGLVCFSVVLPLTLWIGVNWFVRATVSGPASKKTSAAPQETISKRDRQQLEEIIDKRKP